MIVALLAALLVGDSLRTEVIFLAPDGLGAERAITLYDRLLGAQGERHATPGRQPNVVVVRDTPERLARFRALLAELDRPAGKRRLYVRPVRYVAPRELAALIDELRAFPEGRVRMVADDRSGQLVVSATLDDYRKLDRLARKLDVAAHPSERRDIRVTPGPADGDFPP